MVRGGIRGNMQNLDNIELLQDLSTEERTALAAQCVWRSFASGEQILERSSDSRDMYFVVEGSVNIVNYGVSGREVTYATIAAGQYFGELSAIDGRARSANVVASSRCRLAALDPASFEALLMRHPEMMMSVTSRPETP